MVILFILAAVLLFFAKDVVTFNGCVGCVGWLIIVFIIISIIGIVFSNMPSFNG